MKNTFSPAILSASASVRCFSTPPSKYFAVVLSAVATSMDHVVSWLFASARADCFFAEFTALVTEGTIIATRIPMITITTINSTRVKPFFPNLFTGKYPPLIIATLKSLWSFRVHINGNGVTASPKKHVQNQYQTSVVFLVNYILILF